MNVKKMLSALLLICLLPAVGLAKDTHVGISMALFDDNFLTILRTAMQKEMKKEGIRGQIEDAKGDVSQQLQQVQNFIGQGVDVIVVNPVDTNAVKPIIDQATKAGIPLVFVNRKPQITLGTNMAYVGSDSEQAGRLQMEALAKAMNYKGNVAILLGDLANESTRERTKGVKAVIASYPDIKIVEEQTAKFMRNDAVDAVSNWLTAGRNINAIASNNDEMAIGAIQALGKNSDGVLVAGVDGTPDALQMIKNGRMVASVFQDADGQGKATIEIALKLAHGETTEPVASQLVSGKTSKLGTGKLDRGEGSIATAKKLADGKQNDRMVSIPFQLITQENYQQFINQNKK